MLGLSFTLYLFRRTIAASTVDWTETRWRRSCDICVSLSSPTPPSPDFPSSSPCPTSTLAIASSSTATGLTSGNSSCPPRTRRRLPGEQPSNIQPRT